MTLNLIASDFDLGLKITENLIDWSLNYSQQVHII